MQYTINEHRRVALVIIEEEALGVYNADEFAEVLQDPLDKGYKNIIVDLSGVVRLQTHAFGVLVEALKLIREKGGDIQLCVPFDKVIEGLSIAGLLPIFTIHTDQVAAVGSF